MIFVFLASSDLSEQQRERPTSLALRGISMHDYTQDTLQSAQVDCKRTTANKCSFYVFEAGEFDGEEGYWAVDEDDENEDRFLSTGNDIPWTLNEKTVNGNQIILLADVSAKVSVIANVRDDAIRKTWQIHIPQEKQGTTSRRRV